MRHVDLVKFFQSGVVVLDRFVGRFEIGVLSYKNCYFPCVLHKPISS